MKRVAMMKALQRTYERLLLPRLSFLRGKYRIMNLLRRRAYPETFWSTDQGCIAVINEKPLLLSSFNDTNPFFQESEYMQAFLTTLSKDSVVADVGAYHGFYSLLAACHTSAPVYAFEPDEDNMEVIQRYKDLNWRPQIEAVPKAVWKEAGTVTFGGKDQVASIHGGDDVVAATSLDTFFSEKRDTPEIIKLDVEGAELQALHGAKEMLREARPSLFIEVHQGQDQTPFEYDTETLLSFLEHHGYTWRWTSDRGGTIRHLIATPDR